MGPATVAGYICGTFLYAIIGAFTISYLSATKAEGGRHWQIFKMDTILRRFAVIGTVLTAPFFAVIFLTRGLIYVISIMITWPFQPGIDKWKGE